MGVGVGVGGYTGSEHNKNLKPLVVAQFCVHSYRHSDAHRHCTHIGRVTHTDTHIGTVTHTDTHIGTVTHTLT